MRAAVAEAAYCMCYSCHDCRELGRLKEDDLRADEFGFSKPQAKVVLDAVKARKKKFEKS